MSSLGHVLEKKFLPSEQLGHLSGSYGRMVIDERQAKVKAMRPDGITEGETLLVMRAQCGDLAAFEQLLRNVYGPLRNYVVTLAGESDADDILQEVALKIHRKVRHLREPSVFRAWVYRIATRAAFAHLKRAKRWRALENDPELYRSMAAANSNGSEDFDTGFLRLVDHVSPASRAVLLLHYQQHLSLDETAAILDIPVGTAKSRLAYGVATIRKFVLGGNHEE